MSRNTQMSRVLTRRDDFKERIDINRYILAFNNQNLNLFDKHDVFVLSLLDCKAQRKILKITTLRSLSLVYAELVEVSKGRSITFTN